MNKSYLHTIILSAALSTTFVTTTHAAVVAYTDPVAWESAVLAISGHTHLQDFESSPSRNLSTGFNSFPIMDNVASFGIDIFGALTQ